MLPLLASAHGSELIQVRLQFDKTGAATLEMTADYGDNPMLQNEEAARAALQDLLRIEVDGRQHKLSDLAPLQIEERDQLDPTSPMPLPPEAVNTTHQLLTAIWRWLPTGNQLRFTVPKGCMQDSLFWKKEPGAKPQWCVLLGGDFTPVIPVPPRSFSLSLIGLGLLGVFLLVVVGSRVFVCLKPACQLPPSTPSSVSP